MNRREFVKSAGAAAIAGSAVRRGIGEEAAHPVVRTTAGAVRGAMHDGVSVFLGIPYGGDTRQRRFQRSVRPARWSGVRDALAWGDRAPQLGGNGMTSRARQARSAGAETYHLPPDEGAINEDCLHLNVWTPSANTHEHERRPVLLYIHGGAYNGGTVNSVLYDGTRLCRRGDVVVVTVNHRLNAFGFLYLAGLTNDPAYADSGNVGMLDLVLAFQWVKENIAQFGGDPGRVTIFGQSGGGAKCAALMAMPPAHGLFHRVMTMSGQQVTAAPEAIATARTNEFLAKLGLADVAPDKLRAALDAMPLEQLEEAARVSSAWLPVVDGRSLPRDPFSPDAPPISNGVPMILGNTHDETRGLIGGAHPELFSITWEEVPAALEKYVGSFLGDVKPGTIVAKYREWYPQYSPSDVFFAATTAFRSWPGQVIEAERRAASPAQQRTWVYEMDWCSPVAGGRFGAPHTVDIPFFFDNLAMSPGMVGASAEDVQLAQPLATAMSETLIAFGRTGNPNHSNLPHWPAYDLTSRATMIWNTPPQVMDDPRGKERELAAQAHYRQPGT
ncbi:MAG TPA: carboxylesterase family protein [Candidatus Aquilonibacter sp.]|nr:carboxylesterase family protein [Candidatus Aquilonibacter sp.]